MNMSDVVVEVKWTVEDVCDAFFKKYGRLPTVGQLKDCVENVKSSALEDISIENGWKVIEEEL